MQSNYSNDSNNNKISVKKVWNRYEDNRLKELVEECGISSWPTIAEFMPNRTGKQCRERFYNHVDPDIKKGNWTQEEDNMINYWQSQIGNQWARISKFLTGRSDNAVKNRWHIINRHKDQDIMYRESLKSTPIELGSDISIIKGDSRTKIKESKSKSIVRRSSRSLSIERNLSNDSLSQFQPIPMSPLPPPASDSIDFSSSSSSFYNTGSEAALNGINSITYDNFERSNFTNSHTPLMPYSSFSNSMSLDKNDNFNSSLMCHYASPSLSYAVVNNNNSFCLSEVGMFINQSHESYPIAHNVVPNSDCTTILPQYECGLITMNTTNSIQQNQFISMADGHVNPAEYHPSSMLPHAELGGVQQFYDPCLSLDVQLLNDNDSLNLHSFERYLPFVDHTVTQNGHGSNGENDHDWMDQLCTDDDNDEGEWSMPVYQLQESNKIQNRLHLGEYSRDEFDRQPGGSHNCCCNDSCLTIDSQGPESSFPIIPPLAFQLVHNYHVDERNSYDLPMIRGIVDNNNNNFENNITKQSLLLKKKSRSPISSPLPAICGPSTVKQSPLPTQKIKRNKFFE
eukprot:gene6332-8719_t